MATDIKITVPEELRDAMEAAARAEGKSMDEVIAEAARMYLEIRAIEDLAARGKGHAARVGKGPRDAVAAVRELRRGM